MCKAQVEDLLWRELVHAREARLLPGAIHQVAVRPVRLPQASDVRDVLRLGVLAVQLEGVCMKNE